MEDYKEGYFMVWANYMSTCNSIVWLYFEQPRSQGLSSPPLVVGRKTLVAAGHVTTCDTNYSTGVESTNNFVDLN